jgi:hypothetical protein
MSGTCKSGVCSWWDLLLHHWPLRCSTFSLALLLLPTHPQPASSSTNNNPPALPRHLHASCSSLLVVALKSSYYYYCCPPTQHCSNGCSNENCIDHVGYRQVCYRRLRPLGVLCWRCVDCVALPQVWSRYGLDNSELIVVVVVVVHHNSN